MRRHAPFFLLAAALAVALLPAAGAVASPPSTSRSAADALSDALKSVSLKLKLIEKLGADALGVRVRVEGDRALLTGTVEKRSSQELAEEVARSVDGIRKVDCRVFERAPAGGFVNAAAEVEDAALEGRVKQRLLREIGAPALRIEVEAVDGVVSLRGTLDDRGVARLAVERAGAVAGVQKVVDLLRT